MNRSLFLTSLLVAPNGKTIAGTNGVYASTDNGVSWNPSGLAGKSIGPLGAAANGYLFAGVGYPSIIYRSTDNGTSWNIDTTGLGSTQDQAVSFYTGPSGTVILSFINKVFRSTNNGDSWSLLYNGGANRAAIGLTGNIYLGTANGVLRSTNNGVAWAYKNTGLATTVGVASLLSLPNGDLLATSDIVYRSTNSGDSWQAIGPAVSIGTAHHLVSDGNSTFYVGAYARGVFRTTDGGANWTQQVGGFRGSANKAIAAKTSGEIVTAGESGVFVSTDNGATWNLRGNGLGTHSQSIQTLAVTPSGSLLAVSALNANLFRSTDNGGNWSQIFPPAQIPGPFLSVSPNIVLGGAAGVYRSTNDGVNWASTGTTINQTVMALMRHSNGMLYAGASFGGVYASADTGKTWTLKGLNGQDVRSLVETPSGDILAGIWYTGVYRSTNGGTNWTPLSTATTGNSPKKLYRAGATILGIFGATGGSDAVFASTDGGTTWTSAGSGLPSFVSATDFATTPGGMVVASTSGPAGYSGFGVVRATGTASGVKGSSGTLPAEFILAQNFPNPFNPTTEIRYQVPQASDVRLVVYDILGREAAVLANERKAGGKYEVRFDATGLASGVYLYRLTAGDLVQTRKMVLVR
jgi:photosystem II stability/assembly factor-like uncharacterized protein